MISQETMPRDVAVIQMRADDGMNKAIDSANGTQGTDAGLNCGDKRGMA